jgi:hypothetical protein
VCTNNNAPAVVPNVFSNLQDPFLSGKLSHHFTTETEATMRTADGVLFIDGLTAYDLHRKPRPLVSVAVFKSLIDDLCWQLVLIESFSQLHLGTSIFKSHR